MSDNHHPNKAEKNPEKHEMVPAAHPYGQRALSGSLFLVRILHFIFTNLCFDDKFIYVADEPISIVSAKSEETLRRNQIHWR